MSALKIRHEKKGDHVHLDVYAGPEDGNLGHCGRLVMRVEEFADFKKLLVDGEDHFTAAMTVIFEELP